jgi:hypothetical protein
MELGIRLSFGKASEFRGGFEPPLRYATGTFIPNIRQQWMKVMNDLFVIIVVLTNPKFHMQLFLNLENSQMWCSSGIWIGSTSV